jgi:hypothetical protein
MTIAIVATHDPDGNDSTAGVFDVTFDSNYTTNGYVVNASDFNRHAIYSCTPVQTGTANRIITYDPGTDSTGKLRIWTALGTEATGASNQSSITCRVRVVGPR